MNFYLISFVCLPALLLSQIVFDNTNYTITSINNGPDYIRSNVSFTLGQNAYIGLGLTPWTSPTNNKYFYKYNPSSDSWSAYNTVATFPGNGNMYASAFTLNNKAYVVGGSVASSTNISNELWAYTDLTNSWQKMADFPGSARYGAVSFVIGDFAYYGLGSSQFGTLNDFYKYDAVTNTWSQITSLGSVGRAWANSFVIGNKAYVVDELSDGAFSIASQIWEYDPDFDSWTQKNDFTTTTQASTLRRGSVAFSNWGKGYYGLGAYESYSERNDLYEYDPILDKWTTIFRSFGPNSSFAILVNEGSAFVLNNCAYFGLGRQLNGYEDLNMYRMCDGNPTAITLFNANSECVIKPNPGNGLFTTSCANLYDAYQVYDINGSLITKANLNNQPVIDLTFLHAGIYFLHLINELNIHSVQKIAIVKD